MAKVLTAKAIETMKPGSARMEVPDAALPGLYLVVQPSGAKSWAFRHRVGGKPRKLTLGVIRPSGSPRLGRRHGAAAQAVALGNDPAAEKRQAREEAPRLTVTAQVREYHRRHLSKLRSGAGALRVLELSAVAAWGDRPVTSITKKDVVALIDRVHDERGPAAANMALARVRSFLGWLADRDVIPASPAAGVRMPAQLEARDRVLTDDELRLVWRAAGGLSEPFGAFVRLLILTGQRRDEVARMTADELAGDVWAIPGERAKNGEPHAVPLSPEALAVLAEVKRIGPVTTLHHERPDPDQRLLEGEGGAGPGGGEARGGGRARGAGRLDAPRLRRTCATGLARLGFRVEVTEAVLNHWSGTRAGIVASISATTTCPRSGPRSKLGGATCSAW